MLAPLVDEELIGFQLNTTLNPQATGPFLHHLSTDDERWLIQLQQNKLYFNWIKKDDQPVGAYPGFSTVYKRFEDVYQQATAPTKKALSDISIDQLIKTYSLLYQDRLFWEAHIADLSQIGRILRINTPSVPGANKESYFPNNIAAKYTVPIKEIGGFANINITTHTSDGRQMLILQCELKGKVENQDAKQWFQNSHEIQVKFFEQIFHQDILSQWQ